MTTLNKKYELLTTDKKLHSGRTLYRIRALVSVGLSVVAGDLGGYIEKEGNLSHVGNAWVSGDAMVYGDARVSGGAEVYGDAEVANRSHWLSIGPAKSSGRFTTAYKDTKLGVRVVCGCFTGTVKEFSDQIEKTHKDNKEYLEQYRLFCQLIAFNFGVEQ